LPITSSSGFEELAKQQNDNQEPQYFKGRDAEDYVLARW